MIDTSLFYNSKISISNGLANLFKENDFSLRTRLLCIKNQASKSPAGLSFNRFDDREYKDSLGSNEPEPSKTLTGPEVPS